MSERPPISPRSPRAALEPEQVPPPPKRSERARNPFVVVGNAIITIVLVADDRRRRRLFLRQAEDRGSRPAAGGQGRQHSGARGNDRHRRYPAARRRDRQQSLGVHRQRVCAEGALRTQARRILVSEERQPARRHRHHGRGQGGAARRHDSRRPDLRTDRGPAFRQRYLFGHRPRNAARGHACCRKPTNSRAAPRASR